MPSVDMTTAYVHKDGPARVGAFGANGKEAQTVVTVGAAVPNAAAAPTKAEYDLLAARCNELRAALIACGICQ